MADQAQGPLAGLTVLDFTQFLAGPYATQILGDMGARVIKLEAPAGDWSRTLPPHYVDDVSCYYLSINRNKESIAVDMKTPEGLDLVKRLAEKSDILMENFRPGVLEKLGIDYVGLAERNPGLIWCAISGFGQTGPDRDRPAYDMIVQALSGGMSMTGETGRPAVRAGIPIGDLCAGMYGVIGSLAALEERHKSGQGQYIDISMLDCQVSMLCYQAAYFLHSGESPGRQGRGHDSIPTYRSFICANETELVITANTERMWLALCNVLGLPELAEEEIFATNEVRHANREKLWTILEAAFRQREARDWVPLLQDAGIPVGVVNDLAGALAAPQIQHRGMVMDLDSETGEKIRVAGNPLNFSRSAVDAPRYPPRLGEHSRTVLADLLDIDSAEVDRYVESGAVKNP